MRQHWQDEGAATTVAKSIILTHFANGFAPQSAQEWLAGTEVANSLGVHLGAPPTPIHDEIARLVKAGDAAGAAAVRARSVEAWSYENRAAERWEWLQSHWIPLPSPKEQAAANRVQREAFEREERIQRRTLELLDEQDRAERAKRTAAARRQAEKEIGS